MRKKITFKRSFFIFNTSLVFIAMLLVSLVWLSSEIKSHKTKKELIVTNATNKQKENLKKEVFRVIDYINFMVSIYPETPTEDLQSEILKYVENSRFSYGGYVFVNKLDGTALLFDGKIVKEPKNILNLTDPNGLRIFDLELENVKKPEGGFMEYLFKKMDSENPEPKISYINGYPEWEWIIGAGNYKLDLSAELNDLNQILAKKLYRKIFEILSVFILITLFILLLSSFSSRILQKQFALIDNLFARSLNIEIPEKKKKETKFIFSEIDSFINNIESLIQQKEKIEVEKKEIEEKFSKAFFEQVIPISIVNIKTGDRINVNDSFISFFEHNHTGESVDNIYKNSIWQDSDLQKESVEALRNNKYIKNQQAIMKTSSGKLKHVLVNASMLDIADGNFAIVSLVDITEQKHAIELANKNEEHFRTIIEQSPVGIQITDLKGNVLSVNKSWLKIRNISDPKLIENKINILTDSTAVDFNIAASFQKVLKGEQIDAHEVKFLIKNNKGEEKSIFLIIRAYPLKKPDGTFNNIVILNEDITESKIAKLKLKELNDELASQNEEYLSINEELYESMKEVQMVNSKLEQAKIKAEESDRLKTEFINNLSHEIRTPMNGIVGFSNLLSDPKLTKESRIQYINIIQNSSDQLLKVIDDILEISRLGTKQVKVSREEVCLNNVFIELFSIFDLKAKEKKIPLYIKTALSDKDSTIFTDKLKLSKILNNLIENSLKFTFSGFIEFGYKLISDTNNKEVPNILFYVKDTGIGINPNKQKVIFNRFSQEEKGLSRNFGGLGLGLSIAKENTELIGGKIWVESEKGNGAIFYITIPYEPVIKSEKSTPNLSNKLIDKKLGKKNILIAEDEEINYLYLETILNNLKNSQINIIHAKNGKEAVSICKENPKIDLVLMDIKMPVLDGYEATQEILKLYPDLPIIAQTAYSTTSDKNKALAIGCKRFISKPINHEILISLINEFL